MLTLVADDIGIGSIATSTSGCCHPEHGPTRGDLLLYQGDDGAAIIRVYLPDDSPVDLTGFSAEAQMRRAYADEDPVIAYTFALVIEGSDIKLSIPAADSTLLVGSYVWDLELRSPGPESFTSTIMRGNVEIMPEVTR